MTDQESDIKIVGNFFPKVVFKEIIANIESADHKWGFRSKNPSTDDFHEIHTAQLKDKNIIENISVFQYRFYGEDLKSSNLRLAELFQNFINYQFKIPVKKILRINCNISTPYVNLKENEYSLPHVDIPEKHQSLILYLNDIDGETILFDNFYKDDYNNLKILKRINPVSNMCITFNGLRYHAMRPSKVNLRKIINVNYL